MEAIEPRFEFRSFGQDFTNAFKRMARLSAPVPEKLWEVHSDEIYIVSQTTDKINAKIRNGKMDIKVLLQTVDGLEQWNPVMKTDFPIDVSVLKNDVFAVLEVSVPELIKSMYSFDEFIEMVKLHPQLQAVNIHKQRSAYSVNNTICETGIVLVNGASVCTINSESTVIEDVKKTIKDVGLNAVENINYLQMTKRVIGMINKPLAN
jgi:ribosomal protein L30/L7E